MIFVLCTDSAVWQEVKPYDNDVQIEGLQPFKDFLAVFGRQGGLERVWIAPAAGQ